MRYEVTGASREDGRDVVRVYEATDEEQAMRMANADGIVVDNVDLLIDFGPTMTSSPADWSSRHSAGGSPRPAPREPAMSAAPPPAAKLQPPEPPFAAPQQLSPPPHLSIAAPALPTAEPLSSGSVRSAPAATPAAQREAVPTAPPATVDYHGVLRSSPQDVPAYSGLNIAGTILMIYAVAGYTIGGLMFAIGAFGVLASFTTPSSGGAILVILPVLVSGLGALFSAAVAHGLSAACVALRDIARNSWR